MNVITANDALGRARHQMGDASLAMLLQAHKVCPSDPLACNELGVLTYRNQQYSASEQWLLRALELVPGRLNAGKLALDPCSEALWLTSD